jgi:hypothetical protein
VEQQGARSLMRHTTRLPPLAAQAAKACMTAVDEDGFPHNTVRLTPLNHYGHHNG